MQIDILGGRLAEKDRYFREFSIWPVFAEFRSEEWLTNFSPEERYVAERLLTNFTYFNERMTDALLRAAIQNYFCIENWNGKENKNNIADYVTETAFVVCEGERPHPTDSGHIFARKLRDRLLVPERNIVSPRDALVNRHCFRRFIFVDDFTGSGNQFIETWKRNHTINGSVMSFETFGASNNLPFAYCVCVASWKAKHSIGMTAPQVGLSPAHQLSERHSAIHADSSLWYNVDTTAALKIIKAASQRAGYGAEDNSQRDWRGFHALGLTLAFNHGIPDASLPLFFSAQNGWKPLIARN
jgi:hypothetical protein